ncbi:PadR family transcriptional regulator [Homoserinibacter sp. GY 40078]|uniref:PadR family transcriptional regulator n=1 Tax=Homoserinibacter sp. GY 40078 TaxID=2603275 RepID=UPI0011CA6CC5|nr:PadR family transcriptional regulator [Homoserinibacter sp. GY 40078]TXK18708.1 PadR family transcriptional regulator [Homoserinibacter sp. GY 40078]
MSVRQGLLSVLSLGPNYGYQLRSEFERRTGGTWPLNIGQVYTTLDRLERDGLVRRGASTDEVQVLYEITAAGRDAAHTWLTRPVIREGATRDELAIKLALAVTIPGLDITALIQTQRSATLGALQDLTRLKRTDDRGDLAWELVLESMIFQLEAESRWLDHVEGRLTRIRDGRDPDPGDAAHPRPAERPASESTEAAR